jgi:hypothetical protein
MPSNFTLEYIAFVFFSVVGVLQFVFALNGIRGMLFIRNSVRTTATLSVLLVLAAFTWFFTSAPRNVPDTGLGLDGNAQALWFSVSAAAAVAATALFSSALNHRWGKQASAEVVGIEVLQQTTFMRALAHSLPSRWRKARLWTPR